MKNLKNHNPTNEAAGATLVLVLSATIAALVSSRNRVPSRGVFSGVLSNPVPHLRAPGRRAGDAPLPASITRAAA